MFKDKKYGKKKKEKKNRTRERRAVVTIRA